MAKHMQVYKDPLDVSHALDDLETRVNSRKAFSPSFLGILDASTDRTLPATTLEDCYEKARFAVSVIKARRPALDRIPNHSAQEAEGKPLPYSPPDRTTTSSGKTSAGSRPMAQGRPFIS